jgi:hypothetical protein
VFEGVEVRIVVVATVVPGAPADIVAIVTSLVEVREGVGARIVVVTSLVITSEVAKAPANVVAIVTSVAEVGEWARVVVRITVVEVGEGATEGTARVGVVVVTISEVVPPARPTKLVVLEAMDPIAEESLTMGLGAGVAASVVGAGMGAVFVIGVLESVVDNASEVVGVLRSTVAAYVEVVSIVARLWWLWLLWLWWLWSRLWLLTLSSSESLVLAKLSLRQLHGFLPGAASRTGPSSAG